MELRAERKTAPRWLLLLSLLLLAGCLSPGKPRKLPEEPKVPDAQRVIELDQSGEHAAAARLYRRMASQARPPESLSLELRAADQLLLAGELQQAEQLLQEIDVREWPDLHFLRMLLVAEQRMAANRIDEALELLEYLTPTNLPYATEVRYREDRAAAYRMSGNRLECADELAELDLILRDDRDRLHNQRNLVAQLAELPDTTLELLQPEPPGILGGWMELARMAKRNAGDPRRSALGMERWREAFPNHPALPGLFDGEVVVAGVERMTGGAVVLLPLSGRYRSLGEAVRDGLLSAYYHDEDSRRPQLHFLDTAESDDASALYQRAVAAGAGLVIGPLRKEAITSLAALPSLPTPVLALNWVASEPHPTNLYQFGLAPEDEAHQVAERAWRDNRSAALVLTPEGEWGERILAAFQARWEQLGGILPEHRTYNPSENDFSEPLRGLLNLDESEARRQEMQKLLGKRFSFEPRVRSDADFIFLVGKNSLTRQLRPQLQFHRAAHMPIYSTSHTYGGRPNPRADVDLEGVIFPDIPWLLTEEQDGPIPNHLACADLFPESCARHPRLYAMGGDVYHILRRSSALLGGGYFEVEGLTGTLTLDARNRVVRHLAWARFEQGMPVRLGDGEADEPLGGAAPLPGTEGERPSDAPRWTPLL